MHKHEDERRSYELLGIPGCPGIPYCREWILGTYNMRIKLAEITGDEGRAGELMLQRDGLAREFATRPPLEEKDHPRTHPMQMEGRP